MCISTKLMALAGCMMLAACMPTMPTTPRAWDKPDATQADYDRENSECEKYAHEFDGRAFSEQDRQGFYERCMIAHGWTKRARR